MLVCCRWSRSFKLMVRVVAVRNLFYTLHSHLTHFSPSFSLSPHSCSGVVSFFFWLSRCGEDRKIRPTRSNENVQWCFGAAKQLVLLSLLCSYGTDVCASQMYHPAFNADNIALLWKKLQRSWHLLGEEEENKKKNSKEKERRAVLWSQKSRGCAQDSTRNGTWPVREILQPRVWFALHSWSTLIF